MAKPSTVVSLPRPGAAGQVVLAGRRAVKPGQVLAVGYSSTTPNGFLGRVAAVRVAGARTVVDTVPATLLDAVGNGDLNLANFTDVATGTRLGGGHTAALKKSLFNHDIGKSLSCEGSASASLKGQVGITVTPALHAHFSLFGGLSSADFSLTGTASASLTATAEASAGCKLDRAGLFAAPIHIATLSGSIGPVPVVIVLQGQIYVDGAFSGSAGATSGIHASASITGGVSYAQRRFSPIFSGPNTSFGFDAPTVTATGSEEAHIEPAIQMLLYGFGGPELGVKTGVEFKADTTKTPWWTLEVPIEISASLIVPDLGLSSPTLSLYKHSFAIAHATTPPPGPLESPVVPPPAAQVRHVTQYTTTVDLGCSLQTQEDAHDAFFTRSGFEHAACGTFLALGGTLFGPSDTPAGDKLNGPTGWTPVSQSVSGAGTASDPNVVTTTVTAGGSGVQLTQIDRWVTGGAAVASTYAITAPPGDAEAITLYRGADCFTGDDDAGSGVFDAATQSPGCVHDNGDGTRVTLQLVPITAGAQSVEDEFGSVWADIASQVALPGVCAACEQTPDNGEATSWTTSLTGVDPVTEASRFQFK
ncbi:MAG: hypothetical protein ACR2KV_02350 [Solirubrobacteraceae bacterium]